MMLLVDIFGFASVLLRGLALTAQSLTLGGIAFLILLARPLSPALGAAGDAIVHRTGRLVAWSALALAAVVALGAAMQTLILTGSTDLGLAEAAGALYVQAAAVGAGAALLIALLGVGDRARAWDPALVALGLAVIGASVAASHAASRLDDRAVLALALAVHQAAAAVWIGGIPFLLIALTGCRGAIAWRCVASRFSRMAMASVAAIVAAGILMSVVYVGSFEALYGTAYGIMVCTKAALLVGLLFLGAMNFLAVERLRRDPATPILRLRRFAEAEIGIGITVFFAAASLTSVPPGIDLAHDRVTLSEIVDRMAPQWPSLESPAHDSLALPALQQMLNASAGAAETAPRAFVPGAGMTPPRNAEDVAWSEYNHHWSGILVLAIGLLALAERAGWARWARNWPLLFIALGAFLLFRSDPENWPLGDIGFLESFRDPEVTQHRLFVVLIVGFAFFEWSVRTGRLVSSAAAYVFPLLTALGGALLLTHSHALANVREQLLIEMTHVPLALLGIAAGWSRWLELRLVPPDSRRAAWIWPICFVLVGILLLSYHEA